ncbi:hypothetical protein [Calidithermus roseus]|uniref:Uncharacterized protein n=1 Tax=Calidithermus roseus TaxID=1644118 RepID=A0A399ELA4_9DEIN|nr:hypothetical protein [Calidithermus roseus]RIH85504.1 hypothetical protein Mrose_02178 [Calidithermus roseus]
MLDLYNLLSVVRQTRQAQIEQARLEAEVRRARQSARRPPEPAKSLEPTLKEETCA